MQFVDATPEMIQWRDRLTSKVWGQKITQEQFFEREQSLREVSRSYRKHRVVVLTDEKGVPVSSCETIELRSQFYDAKANKVVEKKSLGLMSLVTDESHRKKGYASSLLKHLIGQARAAGTQYHSVFLFSEVGTKFYQALGFQEVPSEEWVIKVSSFKDSKEIKINPDIKPILRSELNSNFEKWPTITPGSFTIFPFADQINWYLKRQDLYAKFLSRVVPEHIGVKMGSAYLMWIADYKHELLEVLVYQSQNLATTGEMLKAAVKQAKLLGLPEVRMWVTEGDIELGSYFQGQISKQLRDDAIAMILPIDQNIRVIDWMKIMKGIYL